MINNPTPKGSVSRIDALDGIRAIACLMVLVSHLKDQGYVGPDAPWLGHFGVIIFFTLSGFLMGFLYVDKSFDNIAVTRYVAARFSRIAPIYLLVVIAAWTIYNFVDSSLPYPITHQLLPRHLAFSGNASVFWSIPPEVQFYGFFLVVWWAFAAWRGARRLWPLALITAVIAVCLAVGQSTPGTFLASKIQYFICGVLAAVIRIKVPDVSILWPRFALTQAVFLFLAVPGFLLYVGPGAAGRDIYANLLYPLVLGVFVLAASYDTAPTDRSLSTRPLKAIGAWSFSLYLLHLPVLYYLGILARRLSVPMEVATPLAIAAAIAASWLAFRLVEMPSRRFFRQVLEKRLIAVVPPRVAAASAPEVP